MKKNIIYEYDFIVKMLIDSSFFKKQKFNNKFIRTLNLKFIKDIITKIK